MKLRRSEVNSIESFRRWCNQNDYAVFFPKDVKGYYEYAYALAANGSMPYKFDAVDKCIVATSPRQY